MDSIIPKGETKTPFIDPFLSSFDLVSMVPIYSSKNWRPIETHALDI